MRMSIFAFGLMLFPALVFSQVKGPTTPFVVTSNDDTVLCNAIKLKQFSVTCQTDREKREWQNEYVRKIYLPVAKTDWAEYFAAYAGKGSRHIYLQSPELTAAVLQEKMFPRFFDMRPLDEEKDFWTRGLFEILAMNNGYKLCRLKQVKSATPSFASGESENINTFIVFKEFETNGTTLNKHNCRAELAKLAQGCPKAQQILNNHEHNFIKDMQLFLIPLATCN